MSYLNQKYLKIKYQQISRRRKKEEGKRKKEKVDEGTEKLSQLSTRP
ncbi:hypothetical protein [Okeania sp. SIO2B3]|nr:hypothetical protein [Okeania sp. SIO2B3]NET44594.1 hypothetical protein [Okeania sp. SIO2B3]